jgi:CO/xanthine dehydrogenase Mo-binding subunit
MTGLLHEKEFSRRTFLKGGGALIVGFSLAGAATSGKASASYLPDVTQADSWLTINADNTVTLKTSHIDPGNGALTGFLMIAAEELGVDMSQIKHSIWDTNLIVNSGSTGGSTAIQNTGPNVRAAAAYARQALVGMASTQLGVPAASLTVSSGTVSGGGQSVTYGALVGAKLINASIPAAQLNPGAGISVPIANYKIVGTRVPRVDLPAKVTGAYTYVHNIRVPGMLHGRVVRPRGQGPYGFGIPIVSVDAKSIKDIPGAKVIQSGNFLGVVAPKEYDAIQAAAQLKVVWKESNTLAGSGNLWNAYRAQDAAGLAPAKVSAQVGNVDKALASAAKTVTATYKYHYNGHMPIGPCCAVAAVTPTSATIWSSSQSIEGIVTAVASTLSMPVSQIRAFWYEGASSFGPGNQYVDAARAAAVLSQAAGAPVRLQLMRWDEHGYDGYGPAQLMDMRGGIDAQGNLIAYDYTQLGQPGTSLDITDELRGVPYPTPGSLTPNAPNTGPMYTNTTSGNYRTIGKTTQLLNATSFHDGALRDPQGPQTTFASEQLIDELAYTAGIDPIAFRQQNISDPRWLGVLNATAQMAGWTPRVANSVKQNGDVVTGRGFGFGRHGTAGMAGGVAEITVNKKTGKITATKLHVALDVGYAINPGLVENQMVGAAIQGLSRALYEEVGFSKTQVTTLDWVSYPILRFKDHPSVALQVISNPANVPIGAGEPATTPWAGAVANAFFDATGVRIREAPMTPARVRAVLKAAGVA